MPEAETVISTTLYIVADSLDPNEVTELLQMEPTREWRRGDRSLRIKPDGTPSTEFTRRVHRRGAWVRRIDASMEDFDVPPQLEYWCVLLSRHHDALRALRERGCEINVDCYIDEGPIVLFDLSAELIERLAALGISLSFGFL